MHLHLASGSNNEYYGAYYERSVTKEARFDDGLTWTKGKWDLLYLLAAIVERQTNRLKSCDVFFY